MGVVLGIDLGTSNFKFALTTKSGEAAGFARVPVRYVRDKNSGTCVLPSADFCKALKRGITEAGLQAGGAAIEAVSYASQANTFILIDLNGDPITPLVSWQDHRASGLGPELGEFCSRADFAATSGMGLSTTGMSVAKLLWFQREGADIWRKTCKVLSISDYLCFLLTGEFSGDAGTASLTGLMDVRRRRWWTTALTYFGIKDDMLPRLHNPGSILGSVDRSGGSDLGLPDGIPVAAGSLDHHVAAIGAGVGRISDTAESTGTVIACVSFADSFAVTKGGTTGPGLSADSYFRLAFADQGGSLLKEYRDSFAPDFSFADLDGLAESSPVGANGLTAWYALGYSGADRPEGAHGDHARGIMESVAIKMDSLTRTISPGNRMTSISTTGGGSSSRIWCQIKADVTCASIVRTTRAEPACHGASILAGAAAGWFTLSQGPPDSWFGIDTIFTPRPEHQDAYKRLIAEIRGEKASG